MENLVKIFDNYSCNGNNISHFLSSRKKSSYPDMIIIMLCLKGHARINVRFAEYDMKENTFLAIAPGIPFYCIEESCDFKVDIIAIQEHIFDKLSHGIIKFYFYRILYGMPFLKIPEEKMEMCMKIHSYLKNFIEYENDNFFKKQITAKFLDILFFEACNIILHTPDKRSSRARHKDEVTGRFIKMVGQNFRKNRKVEFYADKLNITPKYLSAILKITTGKTATRWIEDYTILEAKTLLRTGTATIQEISYDLGFTTPSHFAKFFKDRTGITPTEARNSQDLLY